MRATPQLLDRDAYSYGVPLPYFLLQFDKEDGL